MSKSLTRVCIAFNCLFILLGCLAKETDSILPGANNTHLYVSMLEGKKIAVVANQTSLIGGEHLVDSLVSRGVRISKIFTPEHGFSGKADAGALVSNDFYSSDSIPVISLYGKHKKPSEDDLDSIDMLLFDLQDLGVRVYTYISSMHYIMEACAKHNIPMLILDRPNPNGHYVDGPMLNKGYQSFVGMHPVPLVHGMTIGEFALMINGEFWLKDSLKCNLQVIPCYNYDHKKYYCLPVNPSPNLRNMHAMYLYPSLVLFEGSVVSVGRGTNKPFTIYGHPDYAPREFSFTPVSLEGSSLFPKLENRICYGENLSDFSLDTLRHNGLNLAYLINMYNKLDMEEEFFIPFFDKLAGSNELREQIIEGWTEEEIRENWIEDLDGYKKIRIKYLLYPDFK